MITVLICLLLQLICSAESESEAFDEMVSKSADYINFLSVDDGHVYDSVNNPQNQVFIEQYVNSCEKYFAKASDRPAYQIISREILPAQIVAVYPVSLEKKEYYLVTGLTGVSLVQIINQKMQTLWEDKYKGVRNISVIDVETDDRAEMILFSEKFYHILRMAKTGKIYSQTLPNPSGIRQIFRIGDKYLGIYTRDTKNRFETGLTLGYLSWIHPGFGIDADLMNLNGDLVRVFSDGKILLVANHETENGMVSEYFLEEGTIKATGNFLISDAGVIIDIIPAVESGKYVLVTSSGICTVHAQSGAARKENELFLGTLKQALPSTAKQISLLDISNCLLKIAPSEKSRPMYEK